MRRARLCIHREQQDDTLFRNQLKWDPSSGQVPQSYLSPHAGTTISDGNGSLGTCTHQHHPPGSHTGSYGSFRSVESNGELDIASAAAEALALDRQLRQLEGSQAVINAAEPQSESSGLFGSTHVNSVLDQVGKSILPVEVPVIVIVSLSGKFRHGMARDR